MTREKLTCAEHASLCVYVCVRAGLVKVLEAVW